ncbi:MAG: hypothetical protein QOI21_1412 [Actinomycetota bacterium]|jgi:hypothetical protein|nr:hypothetical protein [Actinomycetota bacterium]
MSVLPLPPTRLPLSKSGAEPAPQDDLFRTVAHYIRKIVPGVHLEYEQTITTRVPKTHTQTSDVDLPGVNPLGY